MEANERAAESAKELRDAFAEEAAAAADVSHEVDSLRRSLEGVDAEAAALNGQLATLAHEMEAVGHDAGAAGLEAAEALQHASDAAEDLAKAAEAAHVAVDALARGDVELGAAAAAVAKTSDLLAAAQWRLRLALESARDAGVETAAIDADLARAEAEAAAAATIEASAIGDAVTKKAEEAGAANAAAAADKGLAGASLAAAAAQRALAEAADEAGRAISFQMGDLEAWGAEVSQLRRYIEELSGAAKDIQSLGEESARWFSDKDVTLLNAAISSLGTSMRHLYADSDGTVSAVTAVGKAAMLSAADAARLTESITAFRTPAQEADEAFQRMYGTMVDAGRAATTVDSALSGVDKGVADTAKAASAATGFWQRWGNVIHWVVAGGIEFLATAVPAMIAFGGAMLVGVQGAQMLQQHLTALWTAAEATGNVFHQTMGTLLGMKSVLQQAQDAANPHIFALLGAGIGIVKEQAGGLVQAGSQVILVFDRFAARLQYDFSKAGGAGQTMGALLHAMVPDLVEFGQVFGNLGHAIANFASKMPGLAEVLLKLLDAASRLVLWVSKLPTPLIMTAMAMEEIWRWGQPLVAILTRLPALFSAFVASGFGAVPVFSRIAEVFKALLGFAPDLIANLAGVAAAIAPEGSAFEAAAKGVQNWAAGVGDAIAKLTVFEALIGAGLVAAIVGVGIALTRTRSSTEQFTDSFNKMLATAKNVNVMTYIATDFQTATDRINQQTAVLNRYSGAVDYVASTNAKWTGQLRNMEGPLAGAGQGAQNLNDKINILAGKALAAIPGMEGLGHAYTGLFTAEHAASAVQQLTAAQQQQVNAMKNTADGMAYLEQHYHLTAQGALALADAAGVKLASGLTGATQAAIINRTMIDDLVKGYEAMGQPATEVGTDMTALAIQSGLAASKVSQLNQAWDQFMQNLVGGTAGLAGFENSIANMGHVTANASANLAKYTGSMNSSVTGFAASLQSFTGKGAAAWQQFDQVVGTTAPQLIDWLRTAGQEGALGANGQEKFTQAVRDMTAQLVPFASKSTVAQSELMGLASAADHNITSWPAFVKWMKEGHDTIGGLSSIIGDASKNMENMGQVAQNLGNVMNNDLTKMMDAVKLKAYGVQGAFQALGNQLSQMHPDSAKVASTFQTLVSTLSRVFGPSQARQLVTAFVHQFGDTIKNGMIVPENNARDAGNKTSRNLGDGLTSGKGHVTSAVQGIVQNINGLLHPLPGQAHSTGSQTSSGMNAGLSSGLGRIAATAHTMHTNVTAPMQGLPGILEGLGESAAHGLANGLSAGLKWIEGAASALAHAIPSTVARLLASASPSKVMMQQGQFAVDGLTKGLTGGIPQIRAAVKKIIDEIHKDLYAGFSGWAWSKAKLTDPLIQMIEGDNKRLQQLASERQKIANEIKKANQYAAQVSSSIISSSGLAGLTQPTNPKTGATEPWTIGNIQDQMTKQLLGIDAFKHNIDVLKKMGLNKTLLNQIIQAGWQQGGALAQALAHGSASQIKSLNETEESIIKASKQIGKDSANAMFDTGKKAGQGFLSGLKSQEKAIEALMEKIAKDMIKALEKALKIKSPSQEMYARGMLAAQGLAKGLLDGEPVVLAAAKKLATAITDVKVNPPRVTGPLQPGGQVIQIAPGTAPGGIAQPLVVVHQHIAGSVLSQQQLQQYTQTAVLQYAHRNPSNGLFAASRPSGAPVR